MKDAQRIIKSLSLIPHPEGGFYAETYRSAELHQQAHLPARYSDDRCYGTAIYYLLCGQQFSRMHLLQSDEIFHFYFGHPVEMLWLEPCGKSSVQILGTSIDQGEKPQLLVPAGVWQGARLKNPKPESFALMGCTVAPGFDFADFEVSDAGPLINRYPEQKEMIQELCPENVE